MTTTKRTNNPRLTIHQKSEILKHFKEHGLNGREIAEVMKIPHHQVLTYLSKIRTAKDAKKEERKLHKELDGHKATTPHKLNRKSPPPATVEEFLRLDREGKTIKDIAEITGWSFNTVSRYLNPDYRNNRKRADAKAYRKLSTAAPTKVKSSSLIEEIKAEIRAEIKEALLREMLGK